MLQAHSFLWNYLWLAPHFLQVGLAILILRRGLHRLFPIFLSYTIFEASEEFTLYGLDVIAWVPAPTFWLAFRIGLVVEGLLKFAMAGELFLHLLRPWPAVARTGSRLITFAGVVFVLVAAVAAGLTNPPNTDPVISRAHVLQQTLYIIESGLMLFIFSFAGYFRLTWNRRTFGIALGLGILSCQHLAATAITASGILGDKSYLLDFLNLGTYHACVLVWIYYFIVGGKSVATSVVPLPEHSLDLWNRELERLLQQ
jgi:hypothetical protein